MAAGVVVDPPLAEVAVRLLEVAVVLLLEVTAEASEAEAVEEEEIEEEEAEETEAAVVEADSEEGTVGVDAGVAIEAVSVADEVAVVAAVAALLLAMTQFKLPNTTRILRPQPESKRLGSLLVW